MKFAANISTMFDEDRELERLDHAAKLGFKWVEWLFPYQHDPVAIQQRLSENSLELVLINTALGDGSRGERGIAALPHRKSAFQSEMETAIRYASRLEIPMIHVMAGICEETEDRSTYVETFVENLEWAKQQLSDDTQLLIEPLNRQDTPNYLIGTVAEANEVLDLCDCEIGLQFDFYHLQIMTGNLGRGIRDNFDRIRHIQFSSVPGRHEPQFGEVNCDHLFGLLEELGYDGYIGCEYKPKTTVEEGLVWAEPYGL